MTDFIEILTGTPLKLSAMFSGHCPQEMLAEDRLPWWARRLQLRPEQIICAVGFNPHFRELTEVVDLLGYTPVSLIKLRNEIFSQDVYKKLVLDNVLAIYNAVKASPENMQIMHYLLKTRIANIESKIESSVNSSVIEKYKAEVRSIYMEGIASIDFAEDRLSRTDNGFRGLLNEVVIMMESRLLPAGNIFFRDNVLPEEKRKLLTKGLIPLELIEARLSDENISSREKKILQEYLNANKPDHKGKTRT